MILDDPHTSIALVLVISLIFIALFRTLAMAWRTAASRLKRKSV